MAAGRRLPEINTDRIAFAGAYHGWGFHEDGARSGLAAATHLGLPWARRTRVLPRPGRFETTIRHTRRTPFHRTFEHSSTFWLVDLDDLPDHGALARFEARDHVGSADRSIRANVESLLADHGVSLGETEAPGTILMAAHPRSLGHCFNPISVFWCFDDTGAQAAVVVEVHNTYGDRHAYVVHPDEQGRARTDKAMYVSPFHGVDGFYDVAVPLPTDRLHIAVTLRGHDGGQGQQATAFSASLTGTRSDVPAPQDARGRAARQRADPGARHLAVGAATANPSPPRRRTPHTHPEWRRAMTIEHTRPDQATTERLPALEPLVRGPRTAVSAAVARRLFRAAVGRLAITVVEEPTGRSLGQGGPTMRIHRPDEFYARLGRDGLIGFGEAYLTGAWDADDLAGFLTVPAARIATLVPDSLQRLRALVVPRTPGHHRSTEANSQANISHHYDLSNDLFALFLDETLSYSSALFDTSVTAKGDEPPAPGRDPAGARRPAGRPRPQPRPRRGAGPQDRAAARPGRGRRGHPRARDRHRLGRARHPRGPPWRHRPLHHLVDRAARAGRAADRGGGIRRAGACRAARLPRRSAPTGRRTTRCCPSR